MCHKGLKKPNISRVTGIKKNWGPHFFSGSDFFFKYLFYIIRYWSEPLVLTFCWPSLIFEGNWSEGPPYFDSWCCVHGKVALPLAALLHPSVNKKLLESSIGYKMRISRWILVVKHILGLDQGLLINHGRLCPGRPQVSSVSHFWIQYGVFCPLRARTGYVHFDLWPIGTETKFLLFVCCVCAKWVISRSGHNQFWL